MLLILTGIPMLIVGLFGLVVGSFLNVCICRIPKQESILNVPSHCTVCGKRLRWFELIPVVSYLVQGGKCRDCGTPIAIQYPLVEVGNALLWMLIFWKTQHLSQSIIGCMAASAWLVLSVIDAKTFEIPIGCNLFLLFPAIGAVIFDLNRWMEHVIGFFIISVPLYVLFRVTDGKAIGGGDIKLLAVCGLLLGAPKIVLAFVLGCMIGSIVHILRMRLTKAEHMLALGPYLAIGMLLSMLWGDTLLTWYLTQCLGF